VSGVWKWLSKKANQSTLKFIGAGAGVAVGACWVVYLHLFQHAEPPSVNVSAPNGIAAVGSTITNPVVNNNYSAPAPPPPISWSSTHTEPLQNAGPEFDTTLALHPGVRVEIVLKGLFYHPLFAVLCDRPCGVMDIMTNAVGVSSGQPYTTGSPNIVVGGFSIPSELDQGSRVWIDVRSRDKNTIKVLSVQPYARAQ
jgi:hypothetical protein